ncbi:MULTISPECIES: ABC transporter ATP-binding protein [Burkholderia]|uniref:ABC transporter ATP-binding protein n=1 Tax=Burkholderia contaminans TaxID=488447 RepID=A0A2S5DPD9_9BURK|nr:MULTISPECIES: ATP-binding cassette domain-containing protein [Burkholderia]EKS9793908.1 ABC transporter ATP-binding protein [Burkholderia cepacia]EKS9803439.1 ABC transporter ATP-binding protein [Burkholderia cepacia]EKS9811571.1 ABC transporter ATP-binding protein [Burkholderia cepacia]EKS9819390.1 ABC transporter ATP-binding protein [Burkholderia cepacia]EKS9826003.1 ABC transporter ATP-binding protein [Burkholderia cepacia]
MLRFDNIGKRYDKRVIFNGLHYASGAGCVALCDETGSGKSTLLAMLAGTLDADEGEVWIGGHSLRTAPHDAKSALAYVPDDCLAYPLQTGRAFLDLVAAGRKTVVDARTLDLADRFGLGPHLEKRFEQMSFGTRKKLFLTATTLGAPAVVIADDPDSGLDAASRAVLIDLFKTLAADRAVFFSTYDPALARACDARVVTFAELGFAG